MCDDSNLVFEQEGDLRPCHLGQAQAGVVSLCTGQYDWQPDQSFCLYYLYPDVADDVHIPGNGPGNCVNSSACFQLPWLIPLRLQASCRQLGLVILPVLLHACFPVTEC